MSNKDNPKVLCVQLIARILQKPQSEILQNKTIKIHEIIDSKNGNEGGLVPFGIWSDLQKAVGSKINLD